jgi:hypothetical protein
MLVIELDELEYAYQSIELFNYIICVLLIATLEQSNDDWTVE